MSEWLDQHPELLQWVGAQLREPDVKATGREGMTVESVLRCALLKQHRQLSYEELAFHLLDSASFQAFARLPREFIPKKSVLQKTVSRISAATWERINRLMLHTAAQEKLEKGRMVRVDSTVTETPIHEPSDSRLLSDAVRVMVRLLNAAEEQAALPGTIAWHDHRRAAKKRARQIQYSRGQDNKRALYRELLAITRKTLGYVQKAQLHLSATSTDAVAGALWYAEVSHYLPLIERIINQTERRVLKGESVPASEKLFSLFEPHTDIIIKGSRDVQYGHKLNLASGASGLILDVTIEQGNPADSERFLPLLDRQIEIYGCPPRQIAADGGYASKDNLLQAKARGVKDVAFHKKRGLDIEQMVKSTWVYRKLRNFRAGVEAGISWLKRCFGLARCTWKGIEHFKAYVWSGVVAHNLALFARTRAALATN